MERENTYGKTTCIDILIPIICISQNLDIWYILLALYDIPSQYF